MCVCVQAWNVPGLFFEVGLFVLSLQVPFFLWGKFAFVEREI